MKKTLNGKVISTKMEKTIVVLVERKFRHPKYHKVIMRHKKYKAHNELKDIQTGEYVSIQETKPMSKEKKFIVVKKLNQRP